MSTSHSNHAEFRRKQFWGPSTNREERLVRLNALLPASARGKQSPPELQLTPEFKTKLGQLQTKVSSRRYIQFLEFGYNATATFRTNPKPALETVGLTVISVKVFKPHVRNNGPLVKLHTTTNFIVQLGDKGARSQIENDYKTAGDQFVADNS